MTNSTLSSRTTQTSKIHDKLSYIRQYKNTFELGNAYSAQMKDTHSQETKKYEEFLRKQME